MSRSSTGLPENVCHFIAYLFGWISGLVMLMVEKESASVRFQSAQSVTLFGSLTVLNIFLPFIPAIGPLLMAALAPVTLLLWIVMMLMSLFGNAPRLPIIENFAEQLLSAFGGNTNRLDHDD